MPLPTGPQIGFSDYWRIILRRKKIIVICFGLVVGVSAYLAYKQSRRLVYMAFAKVAIEGSFVDVEPLPGPGVLKETGRMSSLFLETQYEIIRSRIVIEKAAKILGWDSPDLDSGIERIKRTITVSPSGKSGSILNVVSITATSSNPRIAMDIANAVAEGYLQQKKEDREKIMGTVYANLESQVREAKTKLDIAERNLGDFKQKEGIIALEGIVDLGTQTVQEVSKAILEIKTTRMERQTFLDTLRELVLRDNISALSLIAERMGSFHPVNIKLKDILFEKENNLNNLLQIYKEKHPEVIKAQAELEMIKQEIKKEVNSAMESLEADIKIKTNLENVLTPYIQSPDFGRKQSKYLELKQEVDLQKDVYTTLLKRLKETDVREQVEQIPEVKIIEPAKLPKSPIQTKKTQILLSPIIGIILGLSLAFFREYLDNTIKTIEDVEYYLELPVLGVIPHVSVKKYRLKKKRIR